MNVDTKLRMSRASTKDDPFVRACRASGFTQNDIARKLGIPPSLLSMYRKGTRKIPHERAEAVEKLTGWKSAPKNWPGGILASD